MVQELVEAGSLSAGHARALIGIDQAEQLARTIVERGLNVREAEALAGQAANRRGRKEPSTRPKDPNVAELAAQLTRCLGLEVAIRAKRDGGMLTIRYSDLAQLDGLLSRLR
jgi:ParB family transcriptional regulator, chromosome partitioning protein